MSAPLSQDPAAEALATVRRTYRKLAGPPRGRPGWRLSALFAALLSGFVAANAAPVPVALATDTALVLAMAVMVSAQRARYGVHVNGWRTRPGRWVCVGLTAL